MKKIIVLGLLVFISVSALAVIAAIPFSSELFDIEVIQHSHMLSIPNENKYPLKADYSFTDSKKTYQLRYSLFKQTENTDADITMPYTMFILPIMLNVSGNELKNAKPQRFNDNDVKNEFNGDLGTTVFIENPKSEFCKGYKYIMMNFYCKKNQGIVVQSILFNNKEFFEERNADEIFHSFKFK